MTATLTATLDPSRQILEAAGPDAETLLQGLLTNDVRRAAPDRAVYAAMLTPQGKYLFDLFLTRPAPETFLLDAPADAGALKRLSMYKLRAQATLTARDDLGVGLFLDEAPAPPGALGLAPDPRDPGLGRRAAVPREALAADDDALRAYAMRRIARGAPAHGAELIPNDTFPLEADFERLQGVDFRKGCYVGQEIAARMKHKATLKKRLMRLRIEGEAPPVGAEILAGDRAAGVMGGALDAAGLAILRVDRLEDGAPLTAGAARLTAEPIEG